MSEGEMPDGELISTEINRENTPPDPKKNRHGNGGQSSMQRAMGIRNGAVALPPIIQDLIRTLAPSPNAPGNQPKEKAQQKNDPKPSTPTK